MPTPRASKRATPSPCSSVAGSFRVYGPHADLHSRSKPTVPRISPGGPTDTGRPFLFKKDTTPPAHIHPSAGGVARLGGLGISCLFVDCGLGSPPGVTAGNGGVARLHTPPHETFSRRLRCRVDADILLCHRGLPFREGLCDSNQTRQRDQNRHGERRPRSFMPSLWGAVRTRGRSSCNHGCVVSG